MLQAELVELMATKLMLFPESQLKKQYFSLFWSECR